MSGAQAEKYLIEAVQRGDQQAWREVIARYQGRLLSFARRMLAQRGDAEDLVQETFLGLLRSLPNYDPARSLETYLFAILRHKLHDQFRKAEHGRRQSLEQLEVDEAPELWLDRDTPSRRVGAQEDLSAQRQALVECLRQWVERCCGQGRFQDLMVVEMLMVLGLRNKEVAEDLELTETAVAGIKFRVLEQWRAVTQAAAVGRDWQESDLAGDSTLAAIWREEGISCPKRSTLGRFLLGALDEEWMTFIDFHANQAQCPRCLANLDDLREEEQRDAAEREKLCERCFASSIGFLSKMPDDQ
ncbi:MAG: RNA polymerase sigma factor [Phycisphaerae bacterium]|jgi:RNA polymerase sigma-70 factor (ECF subfamily)|nr:RNA polymerase sigma factor [Phycisphaerae bacterium]HOO17035.1 RNA polymerase sigma factor [Phycisphaerae bacterium]HPC23061.1 RNA polymerase sigma factor [Phycisphaerae bacterium]HRS27626.1 RNA polymerase sigma factor [Phycisphaerae bacterium]HRT41528.1 RNA polymerase sigma factor [Phycisphaerae bacterium]